MVSTSRTARVVPEGMVTFCGGGGGGGVEGTAAVTGAAAMAVAGVGLVLVSLAEEGRLCTRAGLRRDLDAGAGAGFVSSAAWAPSCGARAATCRLLMPCFTPGSAAA